MNNTHEKEITEAKMRYDESQSILDYMRLDYLKNGAAAFSPENALPKK